MADAPIRRMELDEALEAVGKLGPFHIRLFACLFVVGIFHGARMTSGYFFLYDQEHSCYIPPSPNESTWLSFTNDGSTSNSSCYIQNKSSLWQSHDDGDGDRSQIPCPHGWVYSDSVMKRTATSEYDLVCDKKLFSSHANTALMLGSLLGSIAFGKISDRFGRKVAFHSALILFIAFGVGMPFSSNFYIFVVTYGISGAASTGMFAASIVTAMEYVMPEHRKIPALLMNVFFPVGEMIMTAIAFGARDWRWIGIAISAPAVLLLSYYWFVPETLRWLMLHKKYQKIDKILRKMAKLNKREVPEVEDDDMEGFAELLELYPQDTKTRFEFCNSFQESMENHPDLLSKIIFNDEATLQLSGKSLEFQRDAERRVTRRDSFFHLFKHCVLAFRVFLTSYNWLVVNLAYFGLLYNSTDLGQGLFMNCFLGAVVEAPAHLLSLFMVDRVGRKKVHCFYFLLVTVATAIAIIVCFEVPDTKWILLLMTMVGKFGSAGLTGTSFLWMTELYPTSVRSTGLGVGAASARVGAILSYYVIEFGQHMESTFGKALPYIVICITSALAFVGCLFMPETCNRTLPSTIEEARHFGRREERDALGETDGARANYGSIEYKSLQA